MKGGKMKSVKKILVPIDFSECSDEAMQYAGELARVFKARILLIHVLQPHAYGMTETFNLVDHYAALKMIAEPLLEESRKKLSKRGLKVETDLRSGMAHSEILEKARTGKADLIVMGSHGRTGLEHFLLGSVAEKVVRLSPCPVLTVRPEKASKSARIKKRKGSGRKAGVTLFS
jgi:nucleotide-binding universal stress UspA family protein